MKKFLVATIVATSVPSVALAHHPLAGMPMETFTHGLMSGFGHPILGFDHLFFVALVGIAAVYTAQRFWTPCAFIGAMLLGCLASSFGFVLPAAEIVIGLSLLTLGYLVLSGRALSLPVALVTFSGFGLFHGAAFGGSIAAQEAGVGGAVLFGYLLGLGVVQYAISAASGWIALNIWKATEATAIQARLAGAVVCGIGVFLSMENAEGIVFDLLGWSS
tara:strand:- start:3328 stop:3981 length:654 start_codon:yes stop_codon:yes gene_type:complete